MRDVLMLLLTAAFFVVCVAYVWWCDRIIGPDAADLTDDALEAEGVVTASAPVCSERGWSGGEGSASDEPQPSAARPSRRVTASAPVRSERGWSGGEGSASDEPQPSAARPSRGPLR
jgi:hypothetical protein